MIFLIQAPATRRPTEIVSEENEEGMTNFQKIKIMVGKDVTDHILHQVSIGNISKAKAEEFVFALHSDIGGKLG